MKKDKEWLNNEVKERIKKIKTNRVSFKGNDFFDEGYIRGMKDVQTIANQLDELEVLLQERMDKNTVYADVKGSVEAFLNRDSVKNLLVPKKKITEEQAYNKIAESFPTSAKEIELVLEKHYSSMLIEFSEELHESLMRALDVEATSKTIEALTGMTIEQIEEETRNGRIMSKQKLPVIPNYVANWIEKYTDYGYDLYPVLKRLENNALSWDSVYKWYRGNTRKFVNAYLTGEYEVEGEQKYVVKLDDECYLQRYEIDNTNIITPFRIVGYLKEVAVKFDDRKKAKKVAELVEGKVEEIE